MREGAGAGRGKAQHLKPVYQRAGVTALTAIFDVVMDRVVVARHGLKRGEIGVGDGTARDVEAVADLQVFEELALREAVLAAVEFGGHGKSTARSAARRACVAALRPSPARIARPCSPIRGAGESAASASAETPGVRGTLKRGMSPGATATAPPVATICGSASQSSKPLIRSARTSAARSFSRHDAVVSVTIAARNASKIAAAFAARLSKLAKRGSSASSGRPSAPARR